MSLRWSEQRPRLRSARPLQLHGTGQRLTQDAFGLAPFLAVVGRLQEILGRQGVVIALEPEVESELVLVRQILAQSLELVGGDAWRQRPPAVTAAQQQDEVGPGAATLTAFDLFQADFQRLLIAPGILADAQRRSTAWKLARRPRQYSSSRGNTTACSALRSVAKSLNVELKKTRKIRLRGLMVVLCRHPRRSDYRRGRTGVQACGEVGSAWEIVTRLLP